MVPSTQWSTWGSEIEVRVTEGAALGCAADIVSAALADVRAACDLTRGDAEIHAVNMAQGVPVQASRRLLALIRSALWAARMTGGAVSPLSREPVDPARVPSIHLEPTFADVRVTGDTVFAPFGVCLDITGTAKAGTAHEAARVAATSLECGVLVRVGDVVATAGHCPIGGWQVDIGASAATGNFTAAGTCVEVLTGTALARARAAVPGPDVADAEPRDGHGDRGGRAVGLRRRGGRAGPGRGGTAVAGRERPRGPGGVPAGERAHHRGLDAPVPARPRRLTERRQTSRPRWPRYQLINVSVDESPCEVGASASVSSGSSSSAWVLPSSTPHWSKESMPNTTPSTNTWCS